MIRNWIVLRARREWTRARQFLCWLRRVNVTMLGTKLRLNLLFRSKTNKLKKILQQGVCVFFYSVVICCSCGVSDLLCVRNESVCVYLTRVCICFAWIPFRLFCPCRDFVQIRSTAYSYGSWTVVCEKESRRKRQKEQKIVEKSVKRNVHTKKKMFWGEWKNCAKREREWDRTTDHMDSCVQRRKKKKTFENSTGLQRQMHNIEFESLHCIDICSLLCGNVIVQIS